MSLLNLTWVHGLYFSEGAGQHCRALGYVFEVNPFGSAGFRAHVTEGSKTESFTIDKAAPTMESAKYSVEVWLSAQIAGLLHMDEHPQPVKAPSASNAIFTEGPEYAQRFADVALPLLGPDSPVVVSPCSTEQGYSGLYFENKVTGLGVKVLHCSKPGLVVMFWGTHAELEFPWSREPLYFKVDEIAEYAKAAVKSYLQKEGNS